MRVGQSRCAQPSHGSDDGSGRLGAAAAQSVNSTRSTSISAILDHPSRHKLTLDLELIKDAAVVVQGAPGRQVVDPGDEAEQALLPGRQRLFARFQVAAEEEGPSALDA